MGFSNTVVDIVPFGPGLVMEYGTFNGASVTTGTISAATTGTYTAKGQYLADVIVWGAADDADHAVICARDVQPNQLKLTFTTSDTGDYYIIGRAR
jgi:hypothetical protein